MKIGAVSYLNTKPLIATLGGSLGVEDELQVDLPSRLATRLASADLDIGLIPVIEFFRGPNSSLAENEYRILSNAMIGCQGDVRSVRLFFRTDPSRVKTMAVDEGSKTSIALSKVLLAEIYGLSPQTFPLAIASDPDQVDADAVLVIGDRAMHPKRVRSFQSDWDLGKKWFEHTGLPFVFAMWVGRAECDNRLWRDRFEVARDEGITMFAELSDRYADSYQLTHEECMEYFEHNLRFKMTASELMGLKTFYEKAVYLGLVSADVNPYWPSVSDPVQQPSSQFTKI